MRYGYFDEENREYVIEKPDTPAPWANYLGSPEYGAIISNNAGGYSFAKSGAEGRILKYCFNNFDRPGRYIYIRDNEDGDYWSASWQPVGKDLNEYKSKCHHGTGYTYFEAEYKKISSKAMYYVPLDAEYEVWELTVKNDSDKKRNLTVTGYAEFTANKHYEEDQVNLQYCLFITKTLFEKNRIIERIHGNLDEIPEGKNVDNKVVEERFFGLAGEKVSGYCGDKKLFLGSYRDYKNPIGVEEGKLCNDLSYNESPCGALSACIKLAPGESKTIAFLLGAKTSKEADKIINKYKDTENVCENEVEELKAHWHGMLNNFTVNTPSKEFDVMLNTWNAYNCFMTFIWSRAASFIYCGLRSGYGYRDTVQDIQGVIHLAPSLAKEKIRFMLSAQVHHGAGLPLVKFNHNAGHENTPEDPSYVKETGHPAYRSDDALWLFPTVYKYITETGDLDFLDEIIPFADKEEGTVYEHLRRGIQFSMDHLGPHGLPAGLHADWNDCLRLGANGESTFVAFQFYYALDIMMRFARQKKDISLICTLGEVKENVYKIVNELCFDEDRYIRGFTESGEIIGKKDATEASMWLNPQSWSVISGLSDSDKAKLALDNVEKYLNTDYGVMLMDPPFHKEAFEGAFAVIYNQGTKENAGIFSQSQGWIILAEALMGNGDRAYKYLYENLPSAQNDKAEVRVLEPYCYGQFTEGKQSPHFGRSHVHWLTGTASTMMVGCVEGILGIRPEFNGLTLSPALPKEWDRVEIKKVFRDKTLNITYLKSDILEGTEIYVNGESIPGNFIPIEKMTKETEIKLITA